MTVFCFRHIFPIQHLSSINAIFLLLKTCALHTQETTRMYISFLIQLLNSCNFYGSIDEKAGF